MNKQPPLALVILDGFGYSKQTKNNAIAHAHTPHLNYWFKHHPHTLLKASGTAVGLIDNLIGNSEVGHLTIGSGRIIPQPIQIIHDAIDDTSFFSLPLLHEQFKQLKHNNGTLHIMGLLSDGGIHSHEKHLYAFIQAAIRNGIHDIVIHPFLDGRDVAPQSASIYLEKLEQALKACKHGIIGSLHGRFYAMDRDHNWERTSKTYSTLTSYAHSKTIDQNNPLSLDSAQKITIHQQTNIPNHYSMLQHTDTYTPAINWRTVLKKNYEKQITDEFIEPTLLNPHGVIKPGDGIICYNFRPDRARQLTAAFTDPSFNHFSHQHIPLTFFITPVSYDDNTHTNVLFPTPHINNTLKEILTRAGKTIFSIAETEKYAHITYFFSGYKEQPFATETRRLIPSLRRKNYIHNPEMSASLITDAVVQSLTHDPKDFYLINYANADMVGHSGNFAATVQAIECLDQQLSILYDHLVTKMNGILCITADHGKAEDMFDPLTQQPRTAHTANDVPLILVQKGKLSYPLTLSKLSDIAPYILQLMNLPIPLEMSVSKSFSKI